MLNKTEELMDFFDTFLSLVTFQYWMASPGYAHVVNRCTAWRFGVCLLTRCEQWKYIAGLKDRVLKPA